MTYTPVKGYWKANASESVPDMSTLASGGFPTSGDPRKGTQPTIVGAAWFYLMDQMRLSVIAAASLPAATPPDAGQFLEALQSWGWIKSKQLPGTALKDGAIGSDQLAKAAITPEKLSKTVVWTEAQDLSESQQSQVRKNIGVDFDLALTTALKGFITENGGTVLA